MLFHTPTAPSYGLQNAKYYYSVYDQSRVYSSVSCLAGCYYILQLVTELQENGFHVPTQGPPKVSCRVFEDNAGALELANNPKLRPRTKHIAIPYHHFRHHVNAGTIIIVKVATQENLEDIFTKPLPLVTFHYLRRKLLGW